MFSIVIYSQDKITEPISQMNFVQNSLDDFLQNKSFKNIKRNLVVSLLTRESEVLIRIIPLFNDFTNYAELSKYQGTSFTYQGFEILYFNKNCIVENSSVKTDNLKILNNESEILELNLPEYYGMEFIYMNTELCWKEEDYFGSIIVNQFPFENFYNNVIYK